MTRKIIKGTLMVVGVVVLLASIYYTNAYFVTEARINKQYTVDAQSISITGDSAEIADGARLVTARGCRDCHGEDLGGKIFINDPPLGFFPGKNLTKGKGGLPADYNVADWVRSLKHGIRRDGRPLLIMPSQEYAHLSEKDMASIIAYMMQLPKIDREFPDRHVGPLGRILTNLGKLPLLPAEEIDHDATLIKAVSAEVTLEFGKYLSTACQGCHRADMKGGDPIAPGFPDVVDISSTGNVGKWTENEFVQTLRTGKTPEGKILDPANMPWNMTVAYTDTELKALYIYLKSL